MFIYFYKLLEHILNYNSLDLLQTIACFILSTVFAHFYTLHEVEVEVETEVEDEIAIEFNEIRKNNIEYV